MEFEEKKWNEKCYEKMIEKFIALGKWNLGMKLKADLFGIDWLGQTVRIILNIFSMPFPTINLKNAHESLRKMDNQIDRHFMF